MQDLDFGRWGLEEGRVFTGFRGRGGYLRVVRGLGEDVYGLYTGFRGIGVFTGFTGCSRMIVLHYVSTDRSPTLCSHIL